MGAAAHAWCRQEARGSQRGDEKTARATPSATSVFEVAGRMTCLPRKGGTGWGGLEPAQSLLNSPPVAKGFNRETKHIQPYALRSNSGKA